MSPKINRSGVSYDENDPRYVPPQGRARERENDVAPGEALDVERNEGALPSRSDSGYEARKLADADEREKAQGEDFEEIEERPRPDYGSWTKARLNEELDRRKIPHDPKANNLVLINLLEESDGGTQTGVND